MNVLILQQTNENLYFAWNLSHLWKPQNDSYNRKASMVLLTEVKVYRSMFYFISIFTCSYLSNHLNHENGILTTSQEHIMWADGFSKEIERKVLGRQNLLLRLLWLRLYIYIIFFIDQIIILNGRCTEIEYDEMTKSMRI